MTVLPDTSIWVDYLRKGEAGSAWALDELLRTREVVVCDPLVAELLTGARRNDRADLWVLFQGLPRAPLERNEWRRVGDIAAALHEHGMTVALTDIEIAVSAVSADAAVWTRNSDFERIGHVLPELRRYEPA